MRIEFFKFQGTGNDFILLDNRKLIFPADKNNIIEFLCNRRFGIGADGLMLLQNKKGYDFEMVYFNSDGKESTMCGNGGRCIAAFAHDLGIIADKGVFFAIDGDHPFRIIKMNGRETMVALKMIDVKGVDEYKNGFITFTGSPHYVSFVNNLNNIDVVSEGRKIRNDERFKKEGINVNFAEIKNNWISVRTYERGVEDETFSCGTGVVASVIVSAFTNRINLIKEVPVSVKGGNLLVEINKEEGGLFHDIWLKGPATMVYKGEIDI